MSSGDSITADGRLSVTRQNINVTEELTANAVIAQTYTGIQVEHFIQTQTLLWQMKFFQRMRMVRIRSERQ